jgi:L-ribulose-5-phosphate 3-epimerase UlaE
MGSVDDKLQRVEWVEANRIKIVQSMVMNEYERSVG